jgi:Tfp pilus assembly PilM family ATPase
VAVVHPPASLARLANLANLISLPARHFAVIDAGSRRVQVMSATVSRGRPRLRSVRVVDAHEEGFSTSEELREDTRQWMREIAPEAVILVLPQSLMLRHVLEVPPGDASQTRTLVEREASRIGGLSESQWAFDSVRLRPFAGMSNPVAAVFCRQTDLQELLEGFVDDVRAVFDVRPAGDALAAAFRMARPEATESVLVDLGAMHTGVTIVQGGQPVFSASYPSGSHAFTEALATDRGCSPEAAEVLKRTEPPALTLTDAPHLRASVVGWLAELERTVAEWRDDHSEFAVAAGQWPVVMAGGGALQPGLVSELGKLAARPIHAWPEAGEGSVKADQATAWGALVLALGLSAPSPSLLPAELRGFWTQQRLWRGLLTFNLVLAVILAVALGFGMREQRRLLAEKQTWMAAAAGALQHARSIRGVAEAYNARLEAMRPVLERQRQTVETLQVLSVLQQQRTNGNYWYVLLADGESYALGSNDVAGQSAPAKPAEPRSVAPGTATATNLPASSRTFVAEVCLVPQGEDMRRALSDLVVDLKRYPLFRNVDVLPAERRRSWVATNLIFPERHFALELNLSEAELMPSIPLPRTVPTNREPARGLRLPVRFDSATSTNPGRLVRPR